MTPADDDILDRVTLPSGGEMFLLRDGKHVAIRVGKRSLMWSGEHGSEDALGEIVAEAVTAVAKPKILVGGLGLGFTVRALLDNVPRAAHVHVVELVREVVKWNKGACGKYAKRPLADRRVKVTIADVGEVIAASTNKYDAIVLDVDNGPDALTHSANAKLYTRAGLARSRAALRKGGVLAVWSAFPSRTFKQWLEVVGEVRQIRPPPTTTGGPRYYVWLATRTS